MIFLQWHKGAGVKLQARENQLEAAEYEQGLKKRPNAFVVQLWQEKGDGVMEVGLNPASLVHRARANLPEVSISLGQKIITMKLKLESQKFHWKCFWTFFGESR